MCCTRGNLTTLSKPPRLSRASRLEMLSAELQRQWLPLPLGAPSQGDQSYVHTTLARIVEIPTGSPSPHTSVRRDGLGSHLKKQSGHASTKQLHRGGEPPLPLLAWTLQSLQAGTAELSNQPRWQPSPSPGSLFHLFNKYLSDTYCVASTLIGSRDTCYLSLFVLLQQCTTDSNL